MRYVVVNKIYQQIAFELNQWEIFVEEFTSDDDSG